MMENGHQQSVEDYANSRYKLLVELQASPNTLTTAKELADSLKSQGAFASLDLPRHNIFPCALNTLKKSATLTLNGGFSELDELRKFVAEQIEKFHQMASDSKPATKEYFKRRAHDLKDENGKLREDLWHVTRAFYKAMTNARNYATESGDSALIARCAEDERELRAMVSLAQNKSGPYTDGATREP